MDELLSDGTQLSETAVLDSEMSIFDSPAYGSDGTTIILPVTATPSPTPTIYNEEEVTNFEILEAIENLSDSDREADEEGESEDPEEEQTEEPADIEYQYSIDDVYSILEQIENDIYINAKNQETLGKFQLGFTVALFFGFVIYCFLGRIR